MLNGVNGPVATEYRRLFRHLNPRESDHWEQSQSRPAPKDHSVRLEKAGRDCCHRPDCSGLDYQAVCFLASVNRSDCAVLGSRAYLVYSDPDRLDCWADWDYSVRSEYLDY
jgi:hypothetical protein